MISGLWYGVNWIYVIWGHGVAQAAEKMLKLDKPKNKGTMWWLRVFGCFLFVAFAWIFFRVQTLSEAVYVIANAFHGAASPVSYVINGMRGMNIGLVSIIKII